MRGRRGAFRTRRRFNTQKRKEKEIIQKRVSKREKERIIIKNVSQKEKKKKKKLHVLRARVALYQQKESVLREKHTKKERVICNNTLQKTNQQPYTQAHAQSSANARDIFFEEQTATRYSAQTVSDKKKQTTRRYGRVRAVPIGD